MDSCPVSNYEFARRVGCHFTMASRLRNGKRLPSALMLGRIVDVFHLGDEALSEAMEILAAGDRAKFGEWIERAIFQPA